MDNNNPANMSNADLEKDVLENGIGKAASLNQENVNKSTAAEGTLKDPSQDSFSIARSQATGDANEERDLDDQVHRLAQQEDNQDGSLPSPEDIPAWEGDEIDEDKISG